MTLRPGAWRSEAYPKGKHKQGELTMTNETATTTTDKPKQKPNYYIFAQVAKGQELGKPVGVGYAHGKGKGVNLLVNGQRLVIFPAKIKTEAAVADVAPAEGKGA
jgi:hypothetical protein